MRTRKHNFLLLMFPFIQGLNKGKRSKPILFFQFQNPKVMFACINPSGFSVAGFLKFFPKKTSNSEEVWALPRNQLCWLG